MNNNNGKRKIAVDLDGVVFDFLSPFCFFYNKKHGTNFGLRNLTTYDLHSVFQTPEERLRSEMNEFYKSKLFEELKLVMGARTGIRKLSERHTLGVVTSRPDTTHSATISSLTKHFPGVFSDVYFTSQYGGNGHRQKKSDYCRDQGYEVIIEDVAEYANECSESGVLAFLLTRPWNRNELLHSSVVRVKNWFEISKRLK